MFNDVFACMKSIEPELFYSYTCEIKTIYWNQISSKFWHKSKYKKLIQLIFTLWKYFSFNFLYYKRKVQCRVLQNCYTFLFKAHKTRQNVNNIYNFLFQVKTLLANFFEMLNFSASRLIIVSHAANWLNVKREKF